mgnify:FL=1
MPNAEFFHNSIKHTSSSYLCWLFQLCVAILLSHFNRFCARCLFPYKAVVIVMAFPPEKLLSFIGTTPPSDFLSCISCSYFIIACSTYSLFLRDILGSPELPIFPTIQHAMLLLKSLLLVQPRSSSMILVSRIIQWWFPEGVRCHPACLNLTRLNHFNLRLRPVLRTSCLTFGVASACPMIAIWWLTYLTRVGNSPTGTIDLARPHTPIFYPFVLP